MIDVVAIMWLVSEFRQSEIWYQQNTIKHNAKE